MTTSEELGPELAAWERLVEAQFKIYRLEQANSTDLFGAQVAYRFEALHFRTAQLRRVDLAIYLLNRKGKTNLTHLNLTELNREELITIVPELLKYILEGSISSGASAYIYALAKHTFSLVSNTELGLQLHIAFRNYLTHAKNQGNSSSKEEIVWAVENLFAVGLLGEGEKLCAVVREELGEAEAAAMAEHIKYVLENPDEVVGFYDPRQI